MVPAPTREEVNDDDHETSDQVTTELRRSTRTPSTPEWYGNPVLEIMLLDNGEPSNYEEAMVGQDSNKWLEAMKSEMLGNVVISKKFLRTRKIMVMHSNERRECVHVPS